MQALTVSLLGCGWLGLPVARRLIADGYEVKGSTTSPEKMQELAGAGILPYLINLRPHAEGDLTGFLQTDVLLIDVPPKAGRQGQAFHPAQINALLDAVADSPVTWVIYIGSTSVYPEYNRIVTEIDVTIPDESAAPDGPAAQLVVAEQLVHQLSPKRRTTLLRCAGLMGYDRIPGKYVAGRSVDSGSVPVNYVHRDDAVGLIAAVIQNALTGTFNVVAPLHPAREAVYRKSCAQFGYEQPQFVVPVSPVSFKVVSGDKLARQVGYSFVYPDPLDFFYGVGA